MSTTAQRYPLTWPTGWTRTPAHARKPAPFFATKTVYGQSSSWKTKERLSMAQAMERLLGELTRLGARSEVLSTNIELRLDGLPRSNQPAPKDPGVAVYFTLKGQPRCLACDRWTRVEDNVAALAAHIECIRAVDRYGVGTVEQAFTGYAALPADAATDWHLVLGVQAHTPTNDVEEAYRRLARQQHPDVGGSTVQMARLNAAREAFRRERGLR